MRAVCLVATLNMSRDWHKKKAASHKSYLYAVAAKSLIHD